MKSKCKLILFFFLISLSGCVKQPELKKINSFAIVGNSDTSIFVNSNISISNDNSFDILFDTISYIVFYKENDVAKGSSPIQFTLSSKSVSALNTKSEILLKNISPFFSDFSTLDSIELKVKIKGKASKLKLPFMTSFNVWIKNKDILNQFLNTDFLSKTFRIQSVNINIYADEEKTDLVATIDENINKLININQSTVLPIDFTINNLSAVSSVLSNLFSGNISPTYFLHGNITLNINSSEFILPINYKIEKP